MAKMDLVQYFKDSVAEMKKVAWPNKTEIQRHTILVIAISLGTAVFLGLCDYVLNLGLENVINIIR